MSNSNGLTITPLPQALGATVHGLNVERGLTPQVREQILAAWYQHPVPFFPGLNLSEKQHIAFGKNVRRNHRSKEAGIPGGCGYLLMCAAPERNTAPGRRA